MVLDLLVYSFFGLNFSAFTGLIRILLTAVIIIFTIRIPFKRTYHWMFLIVGVVTILFVLVLFYYSISPDAATAYVRVWFLSLLGTRLQDVVLLQFVIYFVARKVKLWQKLVLIGGYAYVTVTVWVPLAIGDTSFVIGKAVLTSLGWNDGPGTSDPYLRPYGIDLFTAVTAALIFALLFRYYRSEKSPLVRGQVEYLVLGTVFYVASAFAAGISRDLGVTTIPNPQQLLAAAADLILLLGLMKKGFYSVAPVAETATSTEPTRYPLEDGHSYLSHDQKAAFEAFSEYVRSGREGLLITRRFPEDVRKDYGLQTTPIRWLAEAKGHDAIPPADLLGLSLMVKDFLDKATKPVVMLHGVEYLTTINGFGPILRLIQGLSEENAAERGILLLPLVPRTLDEKEEALLATETTPLPSPEASAK
jgi:hypothetical protein